MQYAFIGNGHGRTLNFLFLIKYYKYVLKNNNVFLKFSGDKILNPKSIIFGIISGRTFPVGIRCY